MAASRTSDAPCTFCQIARKELASTVVFEDEACLAFLDHRPLFRGHCLLIPKSHLETLLDLPAELLPAVFAATQLLTRAIEEAVAAEGSFVAVNNRISQSVPHFHVHIVPRRKGDGLKGFFWPRQKYKDPKDALETAQLIRAAIGRLRGADP